MHWLNWKMRNLFSRKAKRRDKGQRGFKPRLEALEDRFAPAVTDFLTTPTGIISGRVFFDSNTNNLFDPGETGARGVKITLTGTATGGASVNTTTTTDSSGAFTFFQVAPGEYTITRDSPAQYLDAPAAFGNLGGSVTGNTISQISMAQGQVEANVQFALAGIPLSLVSLRQFMTTTTSSDIPGPTAGTGNTAVDRTIQPTSTTGSANASLTGIVYVDADGDGVKDADETTGIDNVEVTLSGIDSNGRAVLVNVRTNDAGVFNFTNLRAGAYTITVSPLISDHRPGAPTVGDKGGIAVRNTQVTNIELAAGATGAGYHFGQIASDIFTTTALTLSAGLLNDTAPPAVTLSSTPDLSSFLTDGKTFDPTIFGQVSNTGVTLSATFVAAPADGDFVALPGVIGPDGRFILNAATLKLVNGNTELADGAFTLTIRATFGGTTVEETVTFTLDRTVPAVSTLQIDGDSDLKTTDSSVTLEGTTEANAFVRVVLPDGTSKFAVADGSGNYTISGAVALNLGPNAFTTHFVDEAGNIRGLRSVIQRKMVGEPEDQVVNADDDDADKVVDLNTLFTDNDMTNSIIRMNTTAGSILVEFFDSMAPNTVRNFFKYLDHASNPYDDVVFHRLVTNFVLQGGGFTYEADDSFQSVNTTIGGNFDGSLEFLSSLPNTLGTIAMAQSSGRVANSQWFFNLNNNTSLNADLGNGTGPFAVFGKVLSGADMRVLNTLAAFDQASRTGTNSAFTNFPTRDFASNEVFPADLEKEELALIDSIDIVRRSEELTYSVKSNSTPLAVTATIVRNQLTLNFNPDLQADAVATIVIEARDEFNNVREVEFTVNVTVTPDPFTGADNTTFTVGTAESFTITTNATPDADLTFTGTLPTGITFTDNGDGTATLAGTAAAGTAGTYSLSVNANNGAGVNVTQVFTLKVADAPTISSANSATFTTGTAGSFVVTTTGSPAADLSFTGTLPTGLSFVDNNNGTATISGTPAANTGGTFNLTITAENGGVPNATQAFTLTVNQAPAITSANTATFSVGSSGSFTINTTGFPDPTIALTGEELPDGVTFTDNGDGTATIAGTPAVGTGDSYSITITASNGVGNNATQTFTLNVNEEPTITSAAATTFTVGSLGTFSVTTTGFPDPDLLRTGDALPSGVTFVDNNNGTGTLSGTPAAGTGGTYNLTFTADNNIGANDVQSFVLTIEEEI